jgi:hypothetical protein
MKILCLDPGPTSTGVVIYDTVNKLPIKYGDFENEKLLGAILSKRIKADCMAQEIIVGYGIKAGSSTFGTCEWLGMFRLAWRISYGLPYYPISRPQVNEHVCFNRSANDTAINQALTDRYGGARDVAYGSKKKPGPLYGITNHTRAALALGITCDETILHSEVGQHVS